MKGIWIVAKKDINDLFQSKIYLWVFLMIFLCVPYIDGIKKSLIDLANQGAGSADLRLAAQSYLDNLAYTLPLVLTLLVCSITAGYSIVVDKTKRTLEALLATPLSIRQIWIGKSIAIALPSVALGIGVSILAIAVTNVMAVIPQTGGIIIPGVLPLVCALIVAPLLVSLAVILVSLFQLIITNPKIPALAFTVIYLGIYMTTIFEASNGWNFNLIYLVSMVLLALIMATLNRLLTKERIALSGKG
jgi:ABC-2 type transport system permease protein